MQRRMGDPDGNSGFVEDILLTFDEKDSHEKLRLPTLTLYTGQKLIPSQPQHSSSNNKPPINLHLSLGGSYSNSSTTHHHAAAVDNNNIVINASLMMMKRSHSDQDNINNVDQMPPAHHPQQEIILVDDDHDFDWAARSASENRALIRALRIIKSESCTATTNAHHKRKMSSSSHLHNQGVVFQEEVEVEGGIGNSMMNPDDFLSINLDDDSINAFKDTSSSSSSSENNIRLLFPTHHDKGKSDPPIPNYYHYYYNNNIVAPQGGALLGSTKSPLKENPMIMHYHHDHTYTAAAAAAAPPAFAFASNQCSNVPVSGGFPISGALMKKNEYLPDSEVEMIRHMPTVATDGGIPGGRRIEGFLYRYSKYEDVIIVCFCHGSFFTPKEFVMHAAGVTATELQNPMRLITIVPND